METQELNEKLNSDFNGNWLSMAGTEGTGKYVVLAGSELGRLGVRTLPDGQIRVRVEPVEGESLNGLCGCAGCQWKQPGSDGQWRYSNVTDDEQVASAYVEVALKALTEGGNELIVNFGVVPEWATDVVSQFASPDEAEDELTPLARKVRDEAEAAVAAADNLQATVNERMERAKAEAQAAYDQIISAAEAEMAETQAAADAHGQKSIELSIAAAMINAGGRFASQAGFVMPELVDPNAPPAYTIEQLQTMDRKALRELLRNRGEKPKATLSLKALRDMLLGSSTA